jgi:hypothetical protein
MQLNRQVCKGLRAIFQREQRVQLHPSRLARYIEDYALYNPRYLPMRFDHVVLQAPYDA